VFLVLTDRDVIEVIEEDIVVFIVIDGFGSDVLVPVVVVVVVAEVLVWFEVVVLVVICCWVYSTINPDKLRLNNALSDMVTHLTALDGSTEKITFRYRSISSR